MTDFTDEAMLCPSTTRNESIVSHTVVTPSSSTAQGQDQLAFVSRSQPIPTTLDLVFIDSTIGSMLAMSSRYFCLFELTAEMRVDRLSSRSSSLFFLVLQSANRRKRDICTPPAWIVCPSALLPPDCHTLSGTPRPQPDIRIRSTSPGGPSTSVGGDVV